MSKKIRYLVGIPLFVGLSVGIVWIDNEFQTNETKLVAECKIGELEGKLLQYKSSSPMRGVIANTHVLKLYNKAGESMGNLYLEKNSKFRCNGKIIKIK